MPPSVRLDTTAGNGTKPSFSRSAVQIWTPSAALVHTQPRGVDEQPVRIAVIRVAEEAPVGQGAADPDVKGFDPVLCAG